MSEISVIVPAYNSEDTIKRCLDSIIEQSIFDKMEVIAINDGSVDLTLKILKSYEQRYANIKIIDTLNRRSSKSKKLGYTKSYV